MNHGMDISASGVLTNLYRMDVLSNNLSNASTTAFKPDMVAVRQRVAARAESGLSSLPSNTMLERLGSGVLAMPNRIDFTQGALSTSGNSLDVAIRGDGFFVMQDGAGAGADRFRLSRDGRFTKDRTGRLVSATSGLPVLDVNNRPIMLSDSSPVTIDADGSIKQRNATVARLQITDIHDKTRIMKAGQGMFKASSEAWSSRVPGTGSVQQNALEESGTDPIAMLMGITDASRSAESNMQMVSNFDRMMDRAINTMGRVSGG
jgi:flagellar basal body rod protein FlgG